MGSRKAARRYPKGWGRAHVSRSLDSLSPRARGVLWMPMSLFA